MNIIKEETFRSEGRKINQTDDMVRVTADFTNTEWKVLKKGILPKTDDYAPPCHQTGTEEYSTPKDRCLNCRKFLPLEE
jgi:hypothetical protein